jgi:hypothetical protein
MLNTLTVGSLVLALLVAALWVRSYWRWDEVTLRDYDARTLRVVEVNPGYIELMIKRSDLASYRNYWPAGLRFSSQAAMGPRRLPHAFLGFGWWREVNPQMYISFIAVFDIPHWFLLALFAPLPAIRFYHRLRRGHIVLPGHCNKCGYDLRATPDRCPECGTVATAVKTGGACKM